MNGWICVDASVALKLVLIEDHRDRAKALFSDSSRNGVRLIAPIFFASEVDSVIRNHVARGLLSEDAGDAAFNTLRKLPVELVSDPDQRTRAWQLAKQLDLPTVYDASYLALAQIRGCDFWTADERLYTKVRSDLTFVKWIGAYA